MVFVAAIAGEVMAKGKNTAERDRYAAAEDEKRLREYLERSGPEAIHTVKAIVEVLFGNDGPILPRHRKRAVRWIQRLRKLGYELIPCDAQGRMLSDREAEAQASRGIARRWRYQPDGRWTRELSDALDAEARAELADGLVALEESMPPDVFNEPRSRVLEDIRAILTLDEYRGGRRRFEEARGAIMSRHRNSLVNQLSRVTPTDESDASRPQRLGRPRDGGGLMSFLRRQA
jgi:hypothetical protein